METFLQDLSDRPHFHCQPRNFSHTCLCLLVPSSDAGVGEGYPLCHPKQNMSQSWTSAPTPAQRQVLATPPGPIGGENKCDAVWNAGGTGTRPSFLSISGIYCYITPHWPHTCDSRAPFVTQPFAFLLSSSFFFLLHSEGLREASCPGEQDITASLKSSELQTTHASFLIR